MSNIQSFSQKVRITLQALMVLTPLYYTLWFWNSDSAVIHEAYLFGITSKRLFINELSRMLFFWISLLPIAVFILMYYQLARLFKNYSYGNVFKKDNAKIFRNLGILLFCLAAVNFLCTFLMSLALSFQAPPGHRFCLFVFNNYELIPIIAGLVVLGISYVMEEAHKLDEEINYTI